MKKLIPIICIYTVFCAIVCVLYGFFRGEVPSLPAALVFRYKLSNGLLTFLNFLPAIIFTGLTIGCSIAFGRNPDGSSERYSAAMLRRFKGVLLVSLVCVLVLTASVEILVPTLTQRQARYKNAIGMAQDYLRIARDLEKSEQFQLAKRYAQLSVEIGGSAQEANDLIQRIDSEGLFSQPPAADKALKPHFGLVSKLGRAETVQNLKRLAAEAEEKKDWFAAHYFSSEALAIIEEGDANREFLMELRARAWNILSAPDYKGWSEEQEIFAKKLEGYTSLLNGDYLHAYYIFRTLEQTSRELARDPDVVRYLEAAEKALSNEYFFIDEGTFVNAYESATNVYFAIKPKNALGNTKIVYIKGITNVPNSGGAVQYLRNFSVFEIDGSGNYVRGVFSPFAKLLATDVGKIDEATRTVLAIPEKESIVPKILLRSIDRDNENIFNLPAYYDQTAGSPQAADYIYLPMSFADYMLLTEASQGAETMGLGELYGFLPKTVAYGYAEEIFTQVLIDRAFYPFFILAFVIFLASYAWNNRIGKEKLFKFKWILSFPIFTALFYFLYQILLWVFKLQNCAILAVVGGQSSVLACLGFYVFIFVVASVVFLSRNDTTGK